LAEISRSLRSAGFALGSVDRINPCFHTFRNLLYVNIGSWPGASAARHSGFFQAFLFSGRLSPDGSNHTRCANRTNSCSHEFRCYCLKIHRTVAVQMMPIQLIQMWAHQSIWNRHNLISQRKSFFRKAIALSKSGRAGSLELSLPMRSNDVLL